MSMQTEMMDRAATIFESITTNVEKVIRGQNNAIQKLLRDLLPEDTFYWRTRQGLVRRLSPRPWPNP
jgi:hypothetical protein